jgi:hypothetical protein
MGNQSLSIHHYSHCRLGGVIATLWASAVGALTGEQAISRPRLLQQHAALIHIFEYHTAIPSDNYHVVICYLGSPSVEDCLLSVLAEVGIEALSFHNQG